MNLTRSFILYSLLFLVLPLVLKVFGFISISYSALFSFVFLLVGLGLTYINFGTDKNLWLFFGTQLFFLGIFISIPEKFLLQNLEAYYFPAIILSVSFGLLIVYLNNRNKKVLIGVLVGLLLSIIFSYSNSGFRFDNFIGTFAEMLDEYWVVLLLSGLALSIYLFDKRKAKP
ncbi:MAG: hypothetical protein KF721_07625 [Ignavibacteriaceae bacterium]|nr:hypothetical protein [Ignavibacteriaceae bacterium]